MPIRPFGLALGLLTLALLAPPAGAHAQAKAHAASPRSGAAPAGPGVTLTAAWVREAPPGAAMMAGYVAIANPGARPLVLTGVTSPLFAEVQLHVLEHHGELVTMQQVPALTVPAKGHLALAPGGSHMMLLEPKRALHAGDRVPLTLHFGPHAQRTVEALVSRTAPTGDR